MKFMSCKASYVRIGIIQEVDISLALIKIDTMVQETITDNSSLSIRVYYNEANYMVGIIEF